MIKAVPAIFLEACARHPTPATPVWLMRQAGRYQPWYRRLREKHDFLTLCQTPELAAGIAARAASELGTDAAILFSDILLPLIPLGIPLQFVRGEGPRIALPLRTLRQIRDLRVLQSPEELQILQTVTRHTRAALPAQLPLIGFSAGPLTLASYLIEGGSSREFLRTRALMRREPRAWRMLLTKLTRTLILTLRTQVESGAQALQIFDTWAGYFSPSEYRRFALPFSRRLFRTLPPSIPAIHFATRVRALLPLLHQAGGTVLGVDATVSLTEVWNCLGPVALQGNLDPRLLLQTRAQLRGHVRRLLAEAAGRPGHIFNLGHGVLPETPPANARALVDLVHDLSPQYRSREQR